MVHSTNVVKITNKGMVTIPAKLRKKKNLKDGDYVSIEEDSNGNLKISKIPSLEEIRKMGPTSEELKAEMEKSKESELNLEY